MPLPTGWPRLVLAAGLIAGTVWLGYGHFPGPGELWAALRIADRR